MSSSTAGPTIADLIARANQWSAHDPDPHTRDEIATLVAAVRDGDDTASRELASRFCGPLTFGTAGLRGRVGAGESRMNVAVVTAATAGLASYLIERVGVDARVVVGCDARHGSAEFRTTVLEVLSGAGLTALALPPQLPTPVTAFAVRALGADAGVMITASHNPAADNGYKVYLGGRATDDHGRGAQIVAPADVEIAAHIDAASPADTIARDTERIIAVGTGIVDDYIQRAAAPRAGSRPCEVGVVLTPLHGVGGAVARRVLAAAGVPKVYLVTEQCEPDADFPTVAFPNPEEPGALAAAMARAEGTDAQVIIALDPDADRCSVAVPEPDGRWRQLTGDEVGALLAEQAAADDTRPGTVLAASVVSSRLLGKIAAAHGLRSASTLTGFKWIARVPDLRFGYEEALGYCTDPGAVHDKDGISAMVRVITLVEELAAAGLTLLDQLDGLARIHGLYASAQLSFRVDDLTVIPRAMAVARAEGIGPLAGSPIVQVSDLAEGSVDLPPTDGLLFRTAADDRVIIRPSGTEPKLKCYLEVVLPCDEDVPHARAAARLNEIKTDLAAALEFPIPHH